MRQDLDATDLELLGGLLRRVLRLRRLVLLGRLARGDAWDLLTAEGPIPELLTRWEMAEPPLTLEQLSALLETHEMRRLSLERLETRDCLSPAATAVLSQGVLQITGTPQADVVLPTAGANPGDITLSLNGQVSTFSGVQQITADLQGGDDNYQNNSLLSSVVLAGRGDDVIYNILSPLTAFAQDGKGELDRVFHGPTATVQLDSHDREVTFFAPGRTIGSGSVVLEAGVLYVTPSAGASSLTLAKQGADLVLAGDLGDGAGARTWTFDRHDVQTVAYFGSPQADTFVVTAAVDVIGYGGAGNDTLVATSTKHGAYQEWKGLAGNDTLYVASPRALLNGGAGADILLGPAGTIVQGDAADTVILR